MTSDWRLEWALMMCKEPIGILFACMEKKEESGLKSKEEEVVVRLSVDFALAFHRIRPPLSCPAIHARAEIFHIKMLLWGSRPG